MRSFLSLERRLLSTRTSLGTIRPTRTPTRLFYFLQAKKPASLLFIVLKHEDDTEVSGSGQKALQKLMAKYNRVADEVIRVIMERLVNSRIEPGQDPDDYFMGKTLARSEVEKMASLVPTGGSRTCAYRGSLRSIRA